MRKAANSVVLTLILASASVASAQTTGASEDALAARVHSTLRSSEVANAGQIKVEVKGDAVQLSGFVDSEADQEKALKSARDVRGVGTVRNDLVVRDSRPTSAEARDDTVIAAQVRKQIATKVAEGASDINVNVSDGVVQLSGYVADAGVKTRAADVASTVRGVQDVRNDIALK
jgi:hyperosmotically inducible protein